LSVQQTNVVVTAGMYNIDALYYELPPLPLIFIVYCAILTTEYKALLKI